jgi:alpha-tubulin suppressor-like RCC1 family protein
VSAPASGPVTWASMTAGLQVGCGVTTSGVAYCWGNGGGGQLGTGVSGGCCAYASSTIPVPVAGNLRWQSVWVGMFHHVCGLAEDGTVYCWGDTGSATPAPASTTLRLQQVSVADTFNCATALDGSGWCWGDNSYGELGNGTTTSSYSPVPVSGGLLFSTISAGPGDCCFGGGKHACGPTVSGGAGWCWGDNSFGELGNGTFTSSSAPVPVTGGLVFSQIASGNIHSCGLTTAGVAYCWGRAGTLGTGTNVDTPTPTLVADPQ